MARDRTSITKMSRREGYALHPKAQRIMIKRTSLPGQGSQGRRRPQTPSQYAIQLREKQKVKRLYGLLEKQFAKLFKEAQSRQDQTGEQLLQYLERRLDNTVYRAGLAQSRMAARQLVNHGHFTLNGRRVNIPSIRVAVGDEIIVRERSTKSEYFKQLDNLIPADVSTPSWLKVNRKKLTINVSGIPTRDDAEPDIQEQLIVEYYSR